MAKKSEAVAQKKDNENLLWILRIVFTFIFLIVVYYMWLSICTPLSSTLSVLAFIIFLIITIVLKSPGLLDAVLILVIIFSILFTLGTFCPVGPRQCTFPAGISCVVGKLWANTGKLTLQIGQGTGHQIRINGVVCTQNTSSTFTSSANIIYNPTATVNISSGRSAYVADPTSATAGLNNVICTDANNLPLGTTTIGTRYNGKIYINYTELDTNITRVVVGLISERYEA